MRGPSSASIAGSTTSASVAATSATTAPASPIEKRKFCGKIVSEASAAATVTRAERDRPARGGERPAKRVDAEAGPSGLLAVAGDHEQAVVDREAEPEAGDDV